MYLKTEEAGKKVVRPKGRRKGMDVETKRLVRRKIQGVLQGPGVLRTAITCNVSTCANASRGGKVVDEDRYGGPGPRCFRHGGFGFCSVRDCKRTPVGKVVETDLFGGPGVRCRGHRGKGECSVMNCTSMPRRNVTSEDVFGAPGPRCHRHGGGMLHNADKKASVAVAARRVRVRSPVKKATTSRKDVSMSKE